MWDKIVSFFKTSFGLSKRDSSDTIAEEKAIFSKIETEINSFDLHSEDNNPMAKVPKYILNVSSLYYKFGSIHGATSARNFNIDVKAEAHASLLTEHIHSLLMGSIEGLKAQIEVLTHQIDRIKEKLKQEVKFNTELFKDSNNNPNHYSRTRGWLYLFIGIVLMAADIPISLNVVSLYGLIPSFEDDDFITKLANGEALLFALGIAFCTALVKILYDDYINTKLGKWTLEIKDFDDIDKKSIRRERTIKLVVKTIILIMLFAMLISAGLFRDGSLKGNASTNRLISFTLICILIPTISGICLSIGLNNLSNFRRLRKSDNKIKQTQSQISELEKQRNGFVVKESQLRIPYNTWEKSEHKMQKIKSQFVNSYNQGYKKSNLHNFGLNFYDTIEEFYLEYLHKILMKNHKNFGNEN